MCAAQPYALEVPIEFDSSTIPHRDFSREEHAQFVADVNQMVDRFYEETGWHPQRFVEEFAKDIPRSTPSDMASC